MQKAIYYFAIKQIKKRMPRPRTGMSRLGLCIVWPFKVEQGQGLMTDLDESNLNPGWLDFNVKPPDSVVQCIEITKIHELKRLSNIQRSKIVSQLLIMINETLF